MSAHAGFPFYGDLWAIARFCPNLYVDRSSPYIDERLATRSGQTGNHPALSAESAAPAESTPPPPGDTQDIEPA